MQTRSMRDNLILIRIPESHPDCLKYLVKTFIQHALKLPAEAVTKHTISQCPQSLRETTKSPQIHYPTSRTKGNALNDQFPHEHSNDSTYCIPCSDRSGNLGNVFHQSQANYINSISKSSNEDQQEELHASMGNERLICSLIILPLFSFS